MAWLQNKWVRFFGPLLIIAVAAFLLRDKMPFLAEGYQLVLHSNSLGIAIALAASLLSLVCMSEVMRQLLRAGGTTIAWGEPLKLTLISNSWSSTFPGGAAISTLYQFNTIRSWGVTAVVASWFIVVSGALSTVWLIALGVISVVFLGASFALTPLLGSALVMVLLAWLVYYATNHPKKTEAVALKVARVIARMLRKDPDWGANVVRTQASRLDTVHLGLGRFSWVATLSLLNWLLDVAALWLSVWAVSDNLPALLRDGEVPSLMGITLAFVTAKIVGTAQITPAGVGPVEAAMTASLVAVGMTASNAFGAVLVYRLLTFAVPTILGWVVYFFATARGAMPARTAAEKRVLVTPDDR